ncbi:MAG: crossover junction endodeoxyribonuclease RuvC [Cyanobacteria bacterium SIG30]|nr:crossover junction endodeoxyribonuclease RuvC [Cyanobacteria bacterium SIG30]
MRIIGIDPGIQITGYGVIDVLQDGSYDLVCSGSIQTKKTDKTPKRLLEIYEDILTICNKFEPDVASIEQLFFFKNQKTIIPVAQARGVILSALEKCNIEVFEYTPMVVKQVLTGSGRADKKFVEDMVRRTIELKHEIKLDDTIDAIAIAICHDRSRL